MYLPGYSQTVGGSGGSANQVIGISANEPINNAHDVDNYNDEESWQQYLQVLNQSNLFNSAMQDKVLNFNERMRDTQITSLMKQLKENGVNPILAFNNGASLPAYGSSATAQAYSGTAPYSNSARVESAEIRAIASIVGSVIGALGNIGSSALKVF